MKSGNSTTAKTLGKILISTAITLVTNINTGYSQTFTATKHDTIKRMASSQLWDADKAKQQKQANVQKSIPLNAPAAYNIIGDDKYLKTKEEGKRYDEFQVYEIGGLDKNQVALGMLTNTLDRGTRYDEKGAIDSNKMYVATGTLDELDNKVTALRSSTNGKVPVQAIRFHDKYFLIIGNNDYRYVDGKKIGGDQKVVDAMMKGKPITEVTFFYELKQAGIIKNLTVTQFLKMDAAQKQRMLNNGVMAGNL